MSKNMYGLPNHIYLVLGGFKYTSDPNGLIANVLDEHAPALEFQRCMDEDAWLKLQAAAKAAGGTSLGRRHHATHRRCYRGSRIWIANCNPREYRRHIRLLHQHKSHRRCEGTDYDRSERSGTRPRDRQPIHDARHSTPPQSAD
jgi:hypothetical protein